MFSGFHFSVWHFVGFCFTYLFTVKGKSIANDCMQEISLLGEDF